MLDFGLTPQQFSSSYLEQQPHVHQAALSQPLMQWSDLDALLHSIEPDGLALQLFNNGQVPPPSYVEEVVEFGRQRKRLNKHRFYSLLESGATLVLNQLENHSVPAQRLCAEVAQFVGHTTTGNAYVSFGGNGSFGKHWDTHDVFAIQLLGKKRWQVFAPTIQWPLPHQTSEHMKQRCPATPVLDVVLSPGDLLYIPRGWWHQVTPLAMGSLHLSVGAYLPTVRDYIMWACNHQLAQQAQARRGLIDAASSRAALPDILHGLTQAMLAGENFAAFNQDWQARQRLSSPFDTALFLEKKASSLPDGARVSLNTRQQFNAEYGEVAINGGRLKLEPASRAVMMMLANESVLLLGQLYQRLPQIPPTVIRAALIDLARHELLWIEHR
jgi:ribosomal protein L16 Arg81 hydroxylase